MSDFQTFTLHFKTGKKGQQLIQEGNPVIPSETERGRQPRISRLMALAHHIEQKIKDGTFQNMAAVARKEKVSRTRITQIMTLLNLAPDIQTELLFLPKSGPGPAPVTERDVRPIAAETCWKEQRRLWQKLKP